MSAATTDARAAILGRIGAALADVPAAEGPGDVAVARDYRGVDPDGSTHRVDRFAERVAEYRAIVNRVAAVDLIGSIAAACARRGIRRLVVPADLPEGWAPGGVELLRDPGLMIGDLDGADGVLTGCALGIAETGTIVLDGGPGQGRRALSLVPDYHLCVIFERQVVGLLPEAVARLAESAGRPDRPMTWISGPSATSDIELNRVEGVHGPRTLEVLIVGDAG